MDLGKTTLRQVEIAKLFKIDISNDIPEVGYIKIVNYLKKQFCLPIDSKPATEKQIAFARKFGYDVSNYSTEMAGMVLSRITRREDENSILQQNLQPGDIVTLFNRMHPEKTGIITYAISSIKDGMVYFKGGNGKKASARNVRQVR